MTDCMQPGEAASILRPMMSRYSSGTSADATRAKASTLGVVPGDQLAVQDALRWKDLLLHHGVQHIVGRPLPMVDGPAAHVQHAIPQLVQLDAFTCMWHNRRHVADA